MELFDTHCHLQSAVAQRDDFTSKKWDGSDPDETIESARKEGVTGLICVGTNLEDSIDAVEFVQKRNNCWATVGVHPHEARAFLSDLSNKKAFENLLKNPPRDKIVAIGETGLDYYYEHSNKAEQRELLEYQLGLASKHDLPVALHIRDAFDDFWPIFDQFEGLRGVVHSFSSDSAQVDQILSRGLYIGLNGIVTFTKHPDQLDAAKSIPLERLLLETDAPYLTPKPFRGKVCKPEYVKLVAIFLSELRGESIEVVAEITTASAKKVFGIQ